MSVIPRVLVSGFEGFPDADILHNLERSFLILKCTEPQALNETISLLMPDAVLVAVSTNAADLAVLEDLIQLHAGLPIIPVDFQTCAEKLTRKIRHEISLSLSRPASADLRSAKALDPGIQKIIGDSPATSQLKQKLQLLAKTTEPVLLLGESGSGKDVAARALHEASDRSHRPFVSLNCGAFTSTLLDSEFFGCEKGAYTDAVSRPGVLEQADGGTLFLDELGEMPLELQVKLLRALDSKEIRRVGGRSTIIVDFRLICATNVDLDAAVASGKFRRDLLFRVNVMRLRIPPLRERLEDIPQLVQKLLEKCPDGTSMRVSSGAYQKLMAHDWPGNIRELDNIIRRARVLAGCDQILSQHIQFDGI